MIKGETNSFLSGFRWLILLLFFGLFLFFLAGTFFGGAEEEGEPSLPQQTQNRPQETTPQIPQYGAEEDGSMRVTLPPEAPERREIANRRSDVGRRSFRGTERIENSSAL
jgi:cytoskeletal protein RodZ